MKIKAVSGIMLTLLLISMLSMAFDTLSVIADPRIIRVPEDYERIQWAVGNASAGDTILVAAGTYYEHVTIDKSLTLIGEDPNTTIIDGNETGNVVKITADNVNISGFTIRKSGVAYLDSGIRVYSSGNNISYNIITNNDAGILLTYSSNNILTGNNASNNYYGIYLEYSSNNTLTRNNASNKGYGIRLIGSSNNIFTGNTVSSNNYYGILLKAGSNNILTGNNASNNGYGIYLEYSINNALTGNSVSSNNLVGIRLKNSGNNTLVGNNATNNQYNFGVSGEGSFHFNNYVDTSNTVDGKPVYYLMSVADALYGAQTNAGTIYLINCKNVTIRDLNLTRNYYGVFFWNTTNSKIENVTTSNNGCGIRLDKILMNQKRNWPGNNTVAANNASNNRVGIALYYSGNNTLVGNIASSNSRVGIDLDFSSNNTFTGNTVSSNNRYGIDLYYSSNNIIYHNNFINNTKQVYTLESTNVWDNGYPSGGNYWSDHVCSGNPSYGSQPYIIDANNIDHYPFQDPNGWLLKLEHELIVFFLDVPTTLVIGHSSLLNVTVYNCGLNNETDVELLLLINGTVVNNATVLELPTSSSYTLSYLWTPTVAAIYNITAYAPPVPGENLTVNNLVSKMVSVRTPLVHNLDTGLGYITIQEAVNAPETLDGDTILVDSGTYYEHVTIDKSLTLVGENRSVTIIDGNGTGVVVRVVASNVNITEFTIQNGEYGGIRVSGSNCTISGNIVSNNHYGDGIMLGGAVNCTISGNIVSNNYVYGIYLGYHSVNCTISGNTVSKNGAGGIHLYRSGYNTFRDNNITDNYNAFGVFDWPTGWALSDLINDVDVSNTVDGRPIYYLINQHDLRIDPSMFPNMGYLALINSTNIIVKNLCIRGVLFAYTSNSTIKNVTVLDNEYGIMLARSSNCAIIGNTISNNDVGFELSNSHYTIIMNNTVSNNWNGFELSGSHCVISGNTVSDNHYLGVWLDGSVNCTISGNTLSHNVRGICLSECNDIVIYHNNFINNTKHAWIDESFNIIWDDGYPSGGNFWSDYTGVDLYSGPYQNMTGSDGIGDTPYIINYYNRDKYPLMSPWDVIPPTTVHDYDCLWHTANFAINLISTDDLSGVAETYYKINDGPTKIVSVDGQPIITTESANNTLEYWSVDAAGNEETHHILTDIKLDKTSPLTAISILGTQGMNEWYLSDATVTLTATDNVSGVSKTEYSFDNVTWTTYTLPFNITQEETATIYYRSTDIAGNIETVLFQMVKIDKTAPSGSIMINDDDAYTASTSVILSLSASDATAGISHMRFSNDGTTWSDWEPYATSKSWTLPKGDGTKTIYVQFMDNAGLTSQYQDTIILDTTQPTANAGADQTVAEDTLVTFDGSASWDENGIASYTWTFTDITPQTLNGKNPAYTFTIPGTYVVTLTVADNAGNHATDTVIITVLDVTKPIANASSDQTVNEDTLVTFDASASSDNVGITAYTWTFTDVTTKTLTGEKPTYTFNTPGVYTITLNVTDAAGNWATDTIVITVLDITNPIADAGQDQTLNVGATVSFDASGSTDNVGIVSYEWDFGDETTGTGITTTHTYADPRTYTVTLTVKDAAGNTDTHSITITVLPTEAFPLWILGAVAVVIVIAGVAMFLWRRRK